MANEPTQGKIQGRWSRLHSQRYAHLNRARRCSALTLPHLLPEESADFNTALPTPYQGLGARAVNHLASKLWMALLPPNSPFFRLSLAPSVEEEIQEVTNGEALKSDIQNSLAAIERRAVNEVDTKGLRSPAFKAIRHLVTTGNCLVYMPPTPDENAHQWHTETSGLKVFRLDQFVVSRDPVGNLLELVIKEPVAIGALPEDIRNKVEGEGQGKGSNPEKLVDLYTQVYLEDGEYHVRQEVGGEEIDTSYGTYKPEELPWLALRWSVDDDYGRGLVEEYLGDFESLESLSQAIVEGSLAAAKVVFLVNPNGVTRERNLANARNCDFKPGLADDVSVLQMDKYHDFRVAAEEKKEIEQRLSYAFLLHSAVQRNAERVTAEEVRFMAEELEDALGGVYSILAQEFQLPLVRLIMARLQENGDIPNLPKEALNPVITTGLEALGRNHQQAKLRTFISEITQVMGPEAVSTYINAEEYIKRSGTNYGIDTEGLIRTNQEVQQMQQQQQLMAAAQESAPGVAQEMTKGAMQNGSKQQQGE